MSKAWKHTAIAILFIQLAAFADNNGTATLSAGNRFSLDTGSTVSSGGDMLWNGTTLAPQGKAVGLDITALFGDSYSGPAGYALVGQMLLMDGASAAPSTPITGINVGDVIGFGTNGGNVAKLLVTALANNTITFIYTTYGNTTAPNTPTITGVYNNYSYIVPGLPNYGIAPSTLFIITGTNLASTTTVSALESSAAPGIPTQLNGASIKVTVNGVTTTPGMWYAIATQIAAVLPAGTPVGTGTITVTYNGVPSASAPITVVSSALGLDSYSGSGSGLGTVTDLNYNLITYTNSAMPGQNVVLWGSGLGADTGDSDTTYTTTPHPVNVPLTIYIGGIAVTPSYQGSFGYPGLDQINITIPANVGTGCAISVVAVSGSIVSNTVTLPISATGGVCTDPTLGYNGTQLGSLSNPTGSYNSGRLAIAQFTIPQTGLATGASGTFQTLQGGSGSASGLISLGSCSVSFQLLSTETTPTIVGLDAGTITITGPTGTQTLTNEVNPQKAGPTGEYAVQLANSFLPATGGTYTFTGTGGANVGKFTASISYTDPMTWSNMNSISTITRASGQNITWTGGAPGSYVYINGSSNNSTVNATFTCYAPASADQFTIPSYVLLALPASANGSLAVYNSSPPQTFTAPGLTQGVVIAGVSFSISPAYQ